MGYSLILILSIHTSYVIILNIHEELDRIHKLVIRRMCCRMVSDNCMMYGCAMVSQLRLRWFTRGPVYFNREYLGQIWTPQNTTNNVPSNISSWIFYNWRCNATALYNRINPVINYAFHNDSHFNRSIHCPVGTELCTCMQLCQQFEDHTTAS